MKLNYNVVYSSNRKTLTITVERDRSIIVKAPAGTQPEKIQQVVESRTQAMAQGSWRNVGADTLSRLRFSPIP